MTSLSIYDVSVEASSVLLFHPALLNDMNIYLAKETRPQTCQKLTLIIPCVTNETVPKCPDTEQRHDNPCVKNKESRYHPSFVSSKENEQKPKISKNVHFSPDVTDRHVARGSKGACSPPPPPLKVGALKKTQKMKPPCYCWQYRPQTQPIIDQATDLTVCKIGSLIVTVGLYII